MSAESNLWLEDKILSVKASFAGAFLNARAQRKLLEQLLSVRSRRVRPGHPSLADVYQDLAHNYLGYHIDDLNYADQLAQEALNILEFNAPKDSQGGPGGKSFRMGTLIHLRCQIRQRMNRPQEALQFGEEALAIYNANNKLINHQRSSVMHTLVHLNNEVGNHERAERLAQEVKILDQVLMSRAARGRIGM